MYLIFSLFIFMHKGETLKGLIKKSSFTQRKVAGELGVDEQYFSRLLKEENLKDDIVEKACAFIGVDYDKHFGAGVQEPEGDYISTLNFNQYLREKSDWLNEKHELLKEIGEKNKEISELTAENFQLKAKLNLGGLSKLG